MTRILKYLLYIITITILLCAVTILYSKYIVETKMTHESAPKDIKFVTLPSGDEIAYKEINNNSKTTVVFVGGLSGWSGTWDRTIGELNKNKRYNLISIDLPPFGYSKVVGQEDLKNEGNFFRNKQAKRLNSFVEIMGLRKVIFVSHSYGAGVVTEAVMNNPNIVDRLVIIDGVLNIDDKKVVARNVLVKYPVILEGATYLLSHITLLIKNRLESFIFNKDHIDNDLARLYMQSFTTEGNSKRLANWARDYMIDPLKYKSTNSSEYKKLNMPVFVIWGKEDRLTTIDLADNLMKFLKKGHLTVLPNVGHIPMIEDYKQIDSALNEAIYSVI